MAQQLMQQVEYRVVALEEHVRRLYDIEMAEHAPAAEVTTQMASAIVVTAQAIGAAAANLSGRSHVGGKTQHIAHPLHDMPPSCAIFANSGCWHHATAIRLARGVWAVSLVAWARGAVSLLSGPEELCLYCLGMGGCCGGR